MIEMARPERMRAVSQQLLSRTVLERTARLEHLDQNKSIEVKHIYEDGDTVITHSLVTRQDPKAPEIAVVHIFRFEQDRVAELWDVGQPISEDSPNANGMF